MTTAVLPSCSFSSTCITLGISRHTHSEGKPCITMYKCVFLALEHFFSSGRGSLLVLSAPWHAGSPPEHQGESVGPGRHPWHVLWGFSVASSHGEAFRARRAIQAPPKPTYRLKECPTAHVISRFCLLYTSPSPRDGLLSRMPSSA